MPKRIELTITRNEVDNDMLNLVTHSKSMVFSRDKINTILWGVVHEDFLSDDVYLSNLLEQEKSIDVTLTITR
jgi:hypothetical protein